MSKRESMGKRQGTCFTGLVHQIDWLLEMNTRFTLHLAFTDIQNGTAFATASHYGTMLFSLAATVKKTA